MTIEHTAVITSRRRSGSARSACSAVVVLSVLAAPSVYAAGRPITIDDLLAMQRITEPQVSPDGTRVLYTVTTPDLEGNRAARNMWVASVNAPGSAMDGGAHALTTTGKDFAGRWSPDGARIAFISSRDGTAQLWLMDAADPATARRITKLSGGADNIVWAPDGRSIAFTSEVYPDCKDDACNAQRDKAREGNPVKARAYERLLYRHWTSWSEGKRVHPFVVSLADLSARDLIPGADYDAPPREREGPHPMAFSPDSRAVCFIAITDAVEATSTNADLFEVPAAGGAPKKLTTNPGFDGAPAYSPDGKYIAYRSQARAGYESDKWRLMIYDRAAGTSKSLTDAFDRSVDTPIWRPDSQVIYFNAEDRGEMPVFMTNIAGGMPVPLRPGVDQPFDGEFDYRAGVLVTARSSLASPVELFAGDRAITQQNASVLAGLELVKAESFTFKNAGADVQGYLVRPPAFDTSKKYPVVMLLHGGPQTMWGDTWSYRWNAQMFAAKGWVVVMINRRGSTGFGQRFTDEIANDWGGKAFSDLMSGLDFVLTRYPFTDRDRVAAAGASYGAYMIDWMESQAKGRFRALVSHAGVFDLASMYGATEELWFPEHDFGGTPWTNRPTYEKLSPSSYVQEFGAHKTPTLVIAGELDFRVPYTQSLQFFTALQRQGVPSKLILFPDEGHWILKPQNSRYWYSEVLGWLETSLS